MSYQDAMQRAIELRLRAKNEPAQDRKQQLLGLAQAWEIWADTCREAEANGTGTSGEGRPPEDV